jgi:hypothetical protein
MRNSYAMTTEPRWVTPASGPQLVRWGSVFAGTIIAIGAFILLSALWLALSFANHDSVVYNNLSWWIGGTAIFCMFVAGLIAGLSSGARGVAAGGVGALTTWGLVAMAVVLLVVPTFAIGHVPNFVTVSGHVYKINYLTYWTAFWSLLIGLGASLLGGVVGGAVPRRVDGPYLDLQQATAVETTTNRVTGNPVTGNPVTGTRGTLVQEPVPATARTGAAVIPAPSGGVTPEGTDATAPTTYEIP